MNKGKEVEIIDLLEDVIGELSGSYVTGTGKDGIPKRLFQVHDYLNGKKTDAKECIFSSTQLKMIADNKRARDVVEKTLAVYNRRIELGKDLQSRIYGCYSQKIPVNGDIERANFEIGSYERIEISGVRTLFQYPKSVFDEPDAFANYVYGKYAGFQASACNYLMSLNLIRNHQLRFYKADFWEDMVFTLNLATIVQRVVLLPDVTYTYLCRENSLSNSWNQDGIEKAKIVQYFNAVNILKDGSGGMRDKVYYPNRCFFAVLSNLYIICNVLKKWDYITPSFSAKELRDNLKYPVPLFDILHFNQLKLRNISLYVLGNLPSCICMSFIRCYAWIRGY